MESEPTPVLWTLAACVPLLLLAGSATRWVTTGERLVVIRRGVVVRSHGPGLAWRVPLRQRTVLLAAGPQDVLVAARAHTRDGDEVRVLATAVVRVGAPDAGRAWADPREVAHDAVERGLRAAVAALASASLPDALALGGDLLRVIARTAQLEAQPAGAQVEAVEVDGIDVVLAVNAASAVPT